MQRDPAIHIRFSDLVDVLKKADIRGRVHSGEILFDEDIVELIFQYGYKKNIGSRVVIHTNSRTKKKIEKAVEAEVDDVEHFSGIYQSLLIENKIKALSIKKNSSQYLTLKEITSTAVEFCKMFDLTRRDGFQVFIQLGIQILKNRFSIYRLKTAGPKIVEYYQNALVIDKDPTPEKTKKMYGAWRKSILKFYGQKSNVSDINQYVNFVYAKEDADNYKANYQDWMDAQFEKWSFSSTAPAFSQFHGKNAFLNYQIYVGKSTGGSTKEEVEYFNKLSNEKFTTTADKQKEAVHQARIRKSMQEDRPGSD